jgi:hypothetical protein
MTGLILLAGCQGAQTPDKTSRLRGAELDVAQYAANGLTTEAGQVTADIVLWPKVPLPSLSRQRYESLTDQQQQWYVT